MDGGITEVLAIGSLATGALGGITSGIAAQQSANYQAQVARNNATAASNMAAYDIEAGNVKAQDQDEQAAATIGHAKAMEGASGLDVNSGSQAQVVSSDQEISRLNTLRTAQNSSLQATGAKQQSASYTAEAGLDSSKASFALPSSLISTGASVGSQWSSFMQKGLLVP